MLEVSTIFQNLISVRLIRMFPLVHVEMLLHRLLLRKSFATQVTNEWFFSRVDSHVGSKVTRAGEMFVANAARVRLFGERIFEGHSLIGNQTGSLIVLPHTFIQARLAAPFLATHLTHEWPFTRVQRHVNLQVVIQPEGFFARRAFERPFVGVRFQMLT